MVAILSVGPPEEAATELQLKDRAAWQTLREQLDTRAQRHFRKEPAAILTKLAQQPLQ